jgi:hypothetical protein
MVLSIETTMAHPKRGFTKIGRQTCVKTFQINMAGVYRGWGERRTSRISALIMARNLQDRE